MITLANLAAQHRHAEIIVVIAGGPSVQMLDLSVLDSQKHAMIVCNTAYRLFPDAMLAHHSDASWFTRHGEDLLKTFTGQAITGAALGTNVYTYPQRVEKLKHNGRRGLVASATEVSGLNSGQQGLCLAHLFMPKRILLLGFDHTRLNGQSHWQGAEPLTADSEMERLWQSAIKWFDTFAQQQHRWWQELGYIGKPPEIINASPISAISAFTKVDTLSPYLT